MNSVVNPNKEAEVPDGTNPIVKFIRVSIVVLDEAEKLILKIVLFVLLLLGASQLVKIKAYGVGNTDTPPRSTTVESP